MPRTRPVRAPRTTPGDALVHAAALPSTGAPGDGPIVLPTGVPAWITPHLVTLTLKVWQPFSPVQLTPADGVHILTNVGRLLAALRGR